MVGATHPAKSPVGLFALIADFLSRRRRAAVAGLPVLALLPLMAFGACSAPVVEAAPPEAVGGARSAEDASSEQVAAGRRIVELQCVSCHAVLSSDASRHPDAPPLRTLAERYSATRLAEAFALGIMTGHPDMPEFRLSRAQVEAIVAYLESIQTRQAAQLEEGDDRGGVRLDTIGFAAGENGRKGAYGLH